MATTTGVLVEDYSVDGLTGHVALHLRAVETDEAGNQTTGPRKTFGVDAESLLTLYAGDVQVFIEAKRQEVVALLAGTKINTTQLQSLKGTVL